LPGSAALAASCKAADPRDGEQGGGKSAAIAYTLIETAKFNAINPQAWLTDVLGRIADHKITRLDELMPWRYAAAAA
jgi:hypothetical protein